MISELAYLKRESALLRQELQAPKEKKAWKKEVLNFYNYLSSTIVDTPPGQSFLALHGLEKAKPCFEHRD